MNRLWTVPIALFLTATVTEPAFAFVDIAPQTRQLLVFLHVLGVVLFLGNVIVTAMWMSVAKRTRDANAIEFACKAVIRADWMFTLPGVILILIPGLLIIEPFGGLGGASWIDMSLALFLVSGIIWGAVLVPLQKRMVLLTREARELHIALSDQFYVVHRRWTMWGGIATLLPLIALYLMVVKPRLWG